MSRSAGLDYAIRPMRDGDGPRLFDIDTASTALFAAVPIPEIASIAEKPAGSPDEFVQKLAAGPVLVACDASDIPVGFIAFHPVDDDIYVWLLSVHPQHTRRGLGSGLVHAALDAGRSMGAARCVLSTFRDVAFNAPFYRQHGFRELPLSHASAALTERFAEEVPPRIKPDSRLLMAISL